MFGVHKRLGISEHLSSCHYLKGDCTSGSNEQLYHCVHLYLQSGSPDVSEMFLYKLIVWSLGCSYV